MNYEHTFSVDTACDCGVMLSDYVKDITVENKQLRAALEKLTDIWADYSSQEMYGEHLRAGISEIDFDAWSDAHSTARAALKVNP